MKTTSLSTSPAAKVCAKPYDPDALGDLAGCFRNGYTEDDVNDAFGLLARVTGLELGVVWGYVDQYGFGGDSDYAVIVNGVPHDIADGVGELIDLLDGHSRKIPASIELTVGAPIKALGAQGRNYPMVDRNDEDSNDE